MKALAAVTVSFFTLMIAFFPEVSFQAAKEALALCAQVLIPSLLPFLICANLLVSLGAGRYLSKAASGVMMPLFNVGGAGALPLALGMLSGYPCGAATTCRLYDSGALDKSEASRLLAFTNNAGPLFIISAVGIGLYGDRRVGVILYISHILGALFTGLTFRFFGEKPKKTSAAVVAEHKSPFSAVGDSVMSMMGLCGYVVFFAVLSAMLGKIKLLPLFAAFLERLGVDAPTAQLVSSGIFEITTAIKGARCVNLPAVAAMLSMGGISVLMQTWSFVRKSGLSIKTYILGKIMCGGAAALACRILLILFPVDIQTFAPAAQSHTAFYINYITAFAFAAACFFIVYFKVYNEAEMSPSSKR